MKTFDIGNGYTIECSSIEVKTGFVHRAILFKNWVKVHDTKINYINKTWERVEYETVMKHIVHEYFPDKERGLYYYHIENNY